MKINDRFKFRAFDTFAEKMIQNHISICEGELYEWCPDGLHIKHDIGDSAIVMQSTGLKDKNGKLIYEGDIVRYTEYEIDDIEPEWEQTEIVWGGNHDYPAFDLKQNEFDCNGLAYIFNEGWTIEVIGNIYENKELLKCIK